MDTKIRGEVQALMRLSKLLIGIARQHNDSISKDEAKALLSSAQDLEWEVLAYRIKHHNSIPRSAPSKPPLSDE